MSKLKSNKQNVAGGGESDVSLLDKYKGRTEVRGMAFAPIWAPERSGDEILVMFAETKEINPEGKKNTGFKTHNVKLLEWTKGTTFIRSKQPIPADQLKPEMVVSLSGAIADAALEAAKAGEVYIIKYNGLGEKKGKKNAPKLFEVHALKD